MFVVSLLTPPPSADVLRLVEKVRHFDEEMEERGGDQRESTGEQSRAGDADDDIVCSSSPPDPHSVSRESTVSDIPFPSSISFSSSSSSPSLNPSLSNSSLSPSSTIVLSDLPTSSPLPSDEYS